MGPQIFQKSISDLKIRGARRMAWSQFHTEDAQNIKFQYTKSSLPGDLLHKICAPLSNELRQNCKLTRYFSSLKRLDRLWDPPGLPLDTGGYYPGVNRPEREPDHSSPASAEIRYEWS